MRNRLLLVCLLGVSCASAAQSGHSSWANLNGLRAGQKIQIVEVTREKHSGTFVSASDSGIAFNEAAGQKSVERQNVQSVKLMENRRRLRNTLLGLGAGAGAGAGIAAAAWESHGFLGGKGDGAAVGAAIGGLSGLFVGVLWPSHHTVYTASPH
jgi:hypothetical protein